jgi:hypothetical protein
LRCDEDGRQRIIRKRSDV